MLLSESRRDPLFRLAASPGLFEGVGVRGRQGKAGASNLCRRTRDRRRAPVQVRGAVVGRSGNFVDIIADELATYIDRSVLSSETVRLVGPSTSKFKGWGMTRDKRRAPVQGERKSVSLLNRPIVRYSYKNLGDLYFGKLCACMICR